MTRSHPHSEPTTSTPTIYLKNTATANPDGQRHANTWDESDFSYATVLELETAEAVITIRNDAANLACFKYNDAREYQTLYGNGTTATLTLIDDGRAHNLDLYPHEPAAQQNKPFVTLKLTKKTSS